MVLMLACYTFRTCTYPCKTQLKHTKTETRLIVPGPLILDRYRPLSTAGKGGSGTVQICWDTRIQRRVAIKRISIPESSPDGTIPGLSEARTGAMLKHPNIASVIDFETSGQEAFLIMEAIEGPSLSQVIDNAHRGELDLDIIAAVVDAVAEALDFAHENAVLHLDIKPDNILIDQSGIVKVTDFGISELSHAGGFGQASGGTIGYMPPEQANGDDLDQRADEFALAVVVYEMLTGSNPYNAKTIADSLHRMQGELAPVSRTRVDTPPELDDIMASAMSPQIEERFETVIEMADEVMPYLGDVAEGKRKLQALLSDEPDEEEETLYLRPSDVWGRVNPRVRTLAGRAASALLCWWVAALGFVVMGILKTEYAMLFAVVVGAVGALFPGIGALAAMAFLGSGIIVNPGLPLWLGIAVIVLATAWWAMAGRERTAAANTTLAVTPLGLIWATPLAPMLAGFTLKPIAAGVSAAMQSGLALVMGAITATGSMQHAGLGFVNSAVQELPLGAMITDPATWITWASWILGAVCMSALCSRQSRVLSMVGAFIGGALLAAGQTLAVYATTGAWAAPGFAWCAGIAAATILIAIIGAMGAPYRYKEED